MDAKDKREFEFALGYVLKLAEAGRTLDEVERMRLSKRAAESRDDMYFRLGKYPEPELTRRSFERNYAKTRAKLRREADRAGAGRHSLTWQGLRNPITGKFRIPVSFGTKKTNVENASMTPAQANLVALLTKHKGLKDFRSVQRKVNKGSGDFEFIGDPTIFNVHAGRLTNRGRDDFKKAWKYVKGYEPDDLQIDLLAERLFGTSAGFGGKPHIFERYSPRGI